MITNNIIFFDDVKDLKKLTGLTSEELWNLGFNLDDMDCGFCTDAVGCFEVESQESEYCGRVWNWKHNLYYNDDMPSAIYRILTDWDNYCAGYNLAFYNGKVYVTLHHA